MSAGKSTRCSSFALSALFACASAAAQTLSPSAMDRYVDVVREAAPGLPGYTVFRPAELHPAPEKSPVVVWSNGACSASNDSHLYFLTQVAAHGFVVIAFGAPDSHSSPGGVADKSRLADAIDWALSPPDKGGPAYFDRLDGTRIATAGHSCGGIDALWTASNDDRVRSVVSMNSGCFPKGSTGGLSGPLAVCRDDLRFLRGPVLFIAGGPSDVAYANAIANFELVTAVPAAFASHATAGHDGFFDRSPRSVQIEAVQAVVEWLDGTLNDRPDSLSFIVGADSELGRLDGWTTDSKGF